MLPRKYYKDAHIDKKPDPKQEGNYSSKKPEDVPDPDDANLISSELDYPYDEDVPADDRLHAPALDVDLPVQVIESSTPGHYHLYIDRPMTWKEYKHLLRALARAGIIEKGYYKASVKRGATFLRKPGVKKKHPDELPEVQLTWQ